MEPSCGGAPSCTGTRVQSCGRVGRRGGLLTRATKMRVSTGGKTRRYESMGCLWCTPCSKKCSVLALHQPAGQSSSSTEWKAEGTKPAWVREAGSAPGIDAGQRARRVGGSPEQLSTQKGLFSLVCTLPTDQLPSEPDRKIPLAIEQEVNHVETFLDKNILDQPDESVPALANPS